MPDDNEGIRGRLENQTVRNRLEQISNSIPEGPRGKLGKGSLIGAVGFTAVESSKPVWQFVPGIKQPGYKVTAHSTRDEGAGVERHIITVTALSEDVAKFAAKYTAAPSNIDFIRSRTNLVKVDEITERGTYSTYNITVDIETEGAN